MIENRRLNSGRPPGSIHICPLGRKIASDPTGQATVDRFPVVLSGVGTQQMLNVPKLNRTTGTEQDKIQIFRQTGSHRKQMKNGSRLKKSRCSVRAVKTLIRA